MKSLLALGFLTVALAGIQPPSAENLLNDAKTKAAADHRAVFLIFHASWCGWCHKLDNFLESAEVKPVFDKYFVIQHVTVQEHGEKASMNNPGGDALLKRLGSDGGLPYFAFISPSGETLATSTEPAQEGVKGGNIGHPFQPHEVDWFLVMLRKGAPTVTDAEIAPLEKYLRTQKK